MIPAFHVQHALRPLGMSKYRQFDQNGKWIPGKVRINSNSSLRKLMRAARRGRMPPERARTIAQALDTADAYREKYMSAHQRRRHGYA